MAGKLEVSSGGVGEVEDWTGRVVEDGSGSSMEHRAFSSAASSWVLMVQSSSRILLSNVYGKEMGGYNSVGILASLSKVQNSTVLK